MMASILVSNHLSVSSVSAYTASITTSNSIELDIAPTGDGTSIHSESINVQSDCRAGYNLTISTPNGSNLYKYDNNTQSSNTASFTAVDGTSALSSSNNTNKWGYTLTSNPTSSTVFSPLSTIESILKTPSQTASPSSDINDTFSINYGAKVDNTIEAGNYQMANHGAIVYYLTMDTSCTQYTVSFNPNGGTVTGGGNNPTQGIETGVSTKLTSSDSLTAPTGDSYTDAGNNTITGDSDKLWTFWGWNTAVDGTGDWYKDREAVTDLANVGSTITLYAQWKQATLADMTSAPAVQPTDPKQIDHNLMQDMNPVVCYNSPITTAANAPAATLLDYRGKVTTGNNPEQPEQYTVSKLADGLCWMTTNLNLGRSGTDGPNGDGTITLTSDDTDLDNNTTFTLPAGDTTSYTDTTNLAKIRLTNNSGTNANGAYYSWAAAVANTTSTSSNPATSICPKNWDLPTNTQYTNLKNKSNYSSSNRTTAAPSNFLIDGGFTNGATFYQTSYGYFWTNTSNNSTSAYGARINGTTMTTSASNGTTYGGNKYYRKNIRCVANAGTVTINYNANNSSGSTSSQSIDIGSGKFAAANLFSAESNKQFKEWNTNANGTGTSYAANAMISSAGLRPGQNLTLYAIWDDIYYISFNANESSVGGTPGSATGTMSNQTVVRGVATSITTSTFALSGYIFYGWNTAADGTGMLYSDGQKVTNLTSTGNTITLYAVWVDGAYLDTGPTVNQKLKRLAGNNSATITTQDTSITAIVRSNALPNNFIPSDDNTISHSSSPSPIYAWYDSTTTTIYYYSAAIDILMNKTSADLFYEMRALSNLATISSWDTIKVTNMARMFYYTGYNPSSFTLNLSSWDTSSATDMSYMFFSAGYNSSSFTLDLSSWNTSNVITMSSMFSSAGYSATNFSLDLSSWNTAKVTDMSSMFSSAGYSATNFSLDLSSWNTAKVTDMSSMFSSAGYSATTWSVGGISGWNTASVTRMSAMFSGAGYNTATFSLDLSSWNTSSVTNMSSMFFSAGYSATTWSVGNLSSWNTSSVTNMNSMFDSAGYSATTWSVGNLSSWNTSSVTNMNSMFALAGYNSSSFTLDLSLWNTSSVSAMSRVFHSAGYSATTWSVGDLSSWDTSSVTIMSGMFSSAGRSATTWSIGNLSSWNTSSVTSMSSMFSYAGFNSSSFSLNLSSWNTSSVTDVSNMFFCAGYSATTWSVGDLSSWNTSSVTDMSYMFQNAGRNSSSFTLNLSSWNTSSVTSMSQMFYDAGHSATTWSITIPKTNDGTTTGPIANTTSNLYGSTTSVTATLDSGRSFTLAN